LAIYQNSLHRRFQQPKPNQARRGKTMKRIIASNAPASAVLVRFVVGGVFLSEGIQKFLFPNDLGVGRFAPS
jgi:hypothetical protein